VVSARKNVERKRWQKLGEVVSIDSVSVNTQRKVGGNKLKRMTVAVCFVNEHKQYSVLLSRAGCVGDYRDAKRLESSYCKDMKTVIKAGGDDQDHFDSNCLCVIKFLLVFVLIL
jgi:hypothetical protein